MEEIKDEKITEEIVEIDEKVDEKPTFLSRIELIDSKIDKLKDEKEITKSYTTSIRKKPMKKELINEYFDLCSKLGKTPEYSENKLKKTKNSRLEDIIQGLKTNGVCKPGEMTKTIIENGKVVKEFSDKKKKLIAKNLYRLNASIIFGVEKVADIYKDKTGVDLHGLTSDVIHPDNRKDQIDIFEDLTSDYPDFCDKLGTAGTAYLAFMTSLCTQRAMLNKKNPPIRQKNDIPSRKSNENVKNIHKISNVERLDQQKNIPCPKGSLVSILGNNKIGECPT